MRRSPVVAGIGGIAFGVLTIVGLALIGPPGGTFKAHDVSKYLEKGHRVAVIAGLYVELLAVLGLILLLAFLRERVAAWATRVFWTLGTIAAGALALGFAVMAAGAIARAIGGSSVVVPATTSYVISQIGGTIVWGPGGILLAFALIALALSVGIAVPAWLRWLTLVLGIIGLASPAFFPSLALLVWGVVTGLWLSIAGARGDGAPRAATAGPSSAAS
jgi:hypothetical protein